MLTRSPAAHCRFKHHLATYLKHDQHAADQGYRIHGKPERNAKGEGRSDKAALINEYVAQKCKLVVQEDFFDDLFAETEAGKVCLH